MPTYGSFEVIREVYSAPGLTVFSARKSGGSGEAEFAIKVFTPDFDTLMEVEAAGSSTAFERFENRVKVRVEVQKKAAEGSSHVAPVFESGAGNGEVWYVTRFYPRSVNRIIVGHVNLGKHGVHHVLTSIAKGALEIKKAAGRPHGAIHPTNIQIGKAENVRDVEVVLSDPVDGTPADSDRLEKADLRAVGEILYQLVRRRPLEEGAEWLILPIASTSEWTEMFGRDTDRWLKLCNRLLDPVAAADPISLEKLAAELEALTPKPAVSKPMIIAAAAALVLVVGGIVYGYLKGATGTVVATVDPPEATIVAEFGAGGPPMEGKGRLQVKAPKKSRVTLKASYPGLPAATTNVTVQGGETVEARLAIPHGVVRIEAREAGKAGAGDPLEAIIVNPTMTNKTPYTFYVARDGPASSFTVSLTGFLPQDVKTFGLLGQRTNIIISLTRKEADEVAVAVSLQSSPFGAEVVLDGQTNVLPYRQWLVSGKTYVAVARYLDWAPVTNRFTATEKSNRVSFAFPFGTVRFECPNCPEGLAAVYVGNRKIGDTRKEVPWPEGDVEFTMRSEGYDDVFRKLTIRNGASLVFSTNLNRTVGIVQLDTMPAGAEILDGAGKKVGDTEGGKPVRLLLTPGPYSFTARHKNLGALGPTNVVVVKAQTNTVVLRFDFSELVLTSDPVGGEFRDPWQTGAEWKPMQAMSRLILRPGPNSIKVRHAKLTEEDLKLDLARWTAQTQLVQFPYASLVVTSLPPDATILIGGTQRKLPATGWEEPLVPLSPVEFTLSYITNNQTLRGTVRFQPTQRGRYTNGFNFVRREWRNSIGMEFVWLPKTEQGGGFWVGKHEITRQQFKAILQTDPSLLETGDSARPNLPVDNVSVLQARLFCTNLWVVDRSKGLLPELEGGSRDGSYGIPREDEWLYYSKASRLTNAISSQGLPTARKRKGPEPVGSALPDDLGLYDVKGNLWELCETEAEGVATLGGFFAGTALSLEGRPPFGRRAAAPANEGNGNTGFRVVFRPSAKQ